MKRLASGLIILCLCWIAIPVLAFKVYIDPGHYVGDKRTDLEIETNLAVGLKLRDLLKSDTRAGIHWDVKMSRENGEGTAKLNSLRGRAEDANNFEADIFLSIHCNGGGGTGTESFWCDLNANGDPNLNRDKDEEFARLVQKHMVNKGEWNCLNKPWDACRRVVEDFSYLKDKNKRPFHLTVLQFSDAPGCLNEIGFVDNPTDAAKLRDPQWQDKFALAYRDAIYEFFSKRLPRSDQVISIRLFHGWNLISIPGTPVNSDPRSLAGPDSRISFPVYRWDQTVQKWRRTQQLKLGDAYLIWTDNSNGEVIEVPYIPSDQYTLSLKKGWNVIGSVSGNAVFDDFEGSARLSPVLHSWNAMKRFFYRVFPAHLRPGKGYYVKVLAPGTLTVKVSAPAAPLAFETKRSISTADLPMHPPTPFEVFGTPLLRTNFVPSTNKVLANFPNPFNPETWIPFQIKQESVVTLHIYSSAGELVRKLEVGSRDAGVYNTKERAIYWNGQNDQGEPVASGVYFYTLQIGTFQDTKRMFLLK